MIAALIHSTQECVGPKVCRRELRTARIRGATEGDVIRIFGEDGATSQMGSGDLPLPPNDLFVQVEHQKASGNPVTVELV